jgi:hypothetical protein
VNALRIVADERFAAAYETVPDRDRARLKKLIAEVWSWSGTPAWDSVLRQSSFPAGLRVMQMRSPRDWLLVVAHQPVGPGLLLGTVLPPVLSAVREVAVLFVSEQKDLQDANLLALELAGIEQVGCCSPHGLEQAVQEMMQSLEGPHGGLLRLGHFRGSLQGVVSLREKRIWEVGLPLPDRAGLFAGEQAPWDFEALSMAHPHLEVRVWSPSGECPSSPWPVVQGAWEDFLLQDLDVALVPGHRCAEALNAFSLVLTPGQEATWLWPEFPWQVCYVDRLGWAQD